MGIRGYHGSLAVQLAERRLVQAQDRFAVQGEAAGLFFFIGGSLLQAVCSWVSQVFQ